MEYYMVMRMMILMIIRMMFQPSEIIQVTSCHIDDGDDDDAGKPQPQLFWMGMCTLQYLLKLILMNIK